MATKVVQSMISEVSIANQALSWVGANQITSFDDPSDEAEWCRANYPFLRDAVLEERMWTFAQARETSISADAPVWGDGYFAHALPLGWLAVYRVYDTPEMKDPYKVQWHREGEFILADAPSIYMWGLNRITDTGKFTTMFVQALAARMAAEMAIPFTENRTLQADLWGLYTEKLAAAAARDGQQGRNEYITQQKLTNARNGGGGSLTGVR